MDAAQVRANRSTWETIAASFDATRNRPWPTVAEFLQALPPRACVLDAGCGNGRHVGLAREADRRVVGLDLSRRLLVAARRRNPDPRTAWIEGAIERLPFRSDAFDAILAIAVLHHVRGRHERQAVLRELGRVLRPQGRCLVSAWSRHQPRFGPQAPPEPPRDERPVEAGDAMVRWTQHGHAARRFTHLFEAEEWKDEMAASGLRVERVWGEAILTPSDPDNFFAVLAKS